MRSEDRPARRSGAFWVFWLALAAAACAAVAVTTGQHQADPQGTYAAIFGILALFSWPSSCPGPETSGWAKPPI
jgi:hypothetical protein